MKNPLTEFNNGGTHQENPLGGIPQGQNADGQQNLVEEGETKLDSANYVFSDRLKLDKETAVELNIDKRHVGKTFADISKRYSTKDSFRDEDTIEMNDSKKNLETLMNAQEVFKKKELANDLMMMQEKHPEFMAQLTQQNQAPQQPSQEEMMAQQQMQQQMQPPMDPSMMQQGQEQMPQEGAPQMANGGSMYAMGGGLGDPPYKNTPSDFTPQKGASPQAEFQAMIDARDNIVMRNQYQGTRTREFDEINMQDLKAMDQTLMRNYPKEFYDYQKQKAAAQAERSGNQHNLSQAQFIPSGPSGGGFVKPNAMGGYLNPSKKLYLGGGDLEEGGRNMMYSDLVDATKAQEEATDASNANIVNAVGSIPVVGGIIQGGIAVGDMIGKPIKEAVEEKDAEGNMKNEAGAVAGHAVASVFDPFRTNMDTLNSNEASTGEKVLAGIGILTPGVGAANSKKYVEREERKAKREMGNFGNSQAQIDAANLASLNTDYALGGFMGGPGDKDKKKGKEKVAETTGDKYKDWDYGKADPFERPITQDYQKTKTYLEGSPYTRNALDYEHNNMMMVNPNEGRWVPDPRSSDPAWQEKHGYQNFVVSNGTDVRDLKDVERSSYTIYDKDGGQNRTNVYPAQVLKTQLFGQSTSFANGGYIPYAQGGYTGGPYIDPETLAYLESQKQQNIDLRNVGNTGNYTDYRNVNNPTDAKIRESESQTTSGKESVSDYLDEEENPFGDGKVDPQSNNFTTKQTVGNAIGTYLPVAYNLGMGLFGKSDKRKLNDYYKKVEAYKMNIDPQLRATEQTFAAGQNAVRNAGTGASYLASMQGISGQRNKALAELYNRKEMFDASNKQEMDKYNNENEQRARMGIDAYNAQSDAAKRAYLQEGVKQISDISQSNTQNKLDQKINEMYSPTYGGDTGVTSLSEQFAQWYKEKQAKDKTKKTAKDKN